MDAPTAPTGPLAMPTHSPRSIAVYDESAIVDFHIDFPPGEFDKLKAPPGPGDARWVNCAFRFEADSAPAAHCRRKGDPLDWIHEIKPQMIVRFNFIDKQGRLRGLRRINLESFDGAEAPVRDRLAMWIMREAGINAPRVNHARVFKDGQLYGLYMNIESLDKEFLEDHFGADDTGNLWESADELKTNEEVNDNSQLWALENMIEAEPLGGDHASFYRRLDELMDIPQVLREMAAETVMLTDDNFSNGSSNFYYYDHPQRRFMVLPWDLDTILTQGPVNADPFAFWGSSPPNKLRQLINENPSWRAQYTDLVVEIRDRVLTRAVARLDGICNQIRGAVREDPTRTATFQDFETDCAAVRARIPARIEALKQLLGR
jgi:spore coat protein CotH